MTLPRYETIREDLQRVLDRNKLVERVTRITEGIEENVGKRFGKRSRPEPKEGGEWAKHDIKEMIEQQGITYGSYHRLKIEVVTDELAALITNLSGFDEKSDQFLAIRFI